MTTDYEELELTLEELHALHESGEYEIEVDSPDGYTPLLASYFTGEKAILEFTTAANLTDPLGLSPTHPVEVLDDRRWVKASELRVGDILFTSQGPLPLLKIEESSPAPCYDITVEHDNHRFYGNGVSIHNCYGGSAYTVSNNMNESKEQAQEKIDAFFSELPDLLQYMENAKRTAVETAMVYNVFGRSRSVKADLDMGWKGRGYAERTALNHPIQSTAAEFMKIAMIRVGELIIKKGWNPLWGLQVPMVLDPTQIKYTDIKFTMISSVHDELLYLIMKCIMEEVIPEVHMTMQCQDIMDTFQSGYSFEMDCELDTTRSWTATIKYDSAKIYLLRFLLNQNAQKEQMPDANGYTLKFVEMTQDVLNFIKSSGVEGSAYCQGAKLYKLAILKDEVAYRHSSLFNAEFFSELQDKFGVTVSQAVL